MRQSNIELCRIIAIILIIVLHSGFQSMGTPTNVEVSSFLLLLMQAFSNVGINIFILITGYFSVTPKIKPLVNLAYICFFYAICATIADIICNIPFDFKRILFITSSNWFIPSYICLLFIAPILNTYCNNVTISKFKGGLISLFLVLTWFGYLPALAVIQPGLNNGCSTIWFVFVYLLGRYIKLHGCPNWFNKNSVIIFFIGSLITAALAYSMLLIGIKTSASALIGRLYANNSPLILMSSVALFTFFTRINIGESKIINHVAKSVLAVLLVHGCAESTKLMKVYFPYIYEHYSGISLVGLWIASIGAIFLFSVLLDQIRILSYKPINKILNSRLK